MLPREKSRENPCRFSQNPTTASRTIRPPGEGYDRGGKFAIYPLIARPIPHIPLFLAVADCSYWLPMGPQPDARIRDLAEGARYPFGLIVLDSGTSSTSP